MPAILVAYLTGQREEIHIAIPSLLIASAVDTPDKKGFIVSFFLKPSFLFLTLQQSGPKINHIVTTSDLQSQIMALGISVHSPLRAALLLLQAKQVTRET